MSELIEFLAQSTPQWSEENPPEITPPTYPALPEGGILRATPPDFLNDPRRVYTKFGQPLTVRPKQTLPFGQMLAGDVPWLSTDTAMQLFWYLMPFMRGLRPAAALERSVPAVQEQLPKLSELLKYYPQAQGRFARANPKWWAEAQGTPGVGRLKPENPLTPDIPPAPTAGMTYPIVPYQPPVSTPPAVMPSTLPVPTPQNPAAMSIEAARALIRERMQNVPMPIGTVWNPDTGEIMGRYNPQTEGIEPMAEVERLNEEVRRAIRDVMGAQGLGLPPTQQVGGMTPPALTDLWQPPVERPQTREIPPEYPPAIASAMIQNTINALNEGTVTWDNVLPEYRQRILDTLGISEAELRNHLYDIRRPQLAPPGQVAIGGTQTIESLMFRERDNTAREYFGQPYYGGRLSDSERRFVDDIVMRRANERQAAEVEPPIMPTGRQALERMGFTEEEMAAIPQELEPPALRNRDVWPADYMQQEGINPNAIFLDAYHRTGIATDVLNMDPHQIRFALRSGAISYEGANDNQRRLIDLAYQGLPYTAAQDEAFEMAHRARLRGEEIARVEREPETVAEMAERQAIERATGRQVGEPGGYHRQAITNLLTDIPYVGGVPQMTPDIAYSVRQHMESGHVRWSDLTPEEQNFVNRAYEGLPYDPAAMEQAGEFTAHRGIPVPAEDVPEHFENLPGARLPGQVDLRTLNRIYQEMDRVERWYEENPEDAAEAEFGRGQAIVDTPEGEVEVGFNPATGNGVIATAQGYYLDPVTMEIVRTPTWRPPGPEGPRHYMLEPDQVQTTVVTDDDVMYGAFDPVDGVPCVTPQMSEFVNGRTGVTVEAPIWREVEEPAMGPTLRSRGISIRRGPVDVGERPAHKVPRDWFVETYSKLGLEPRPEEYEAFIDSLHGRPIRSVKSMPYEYRRIGDVLASWYDHGVYEEDDAKNLLTMMRGRLDAIHDMLNNIFARGASAPRAPRLAQDLSRLALPAPGTSSTDFQEALSDVVNNTLNELALNPDFDDFAQKSLAQLANFTRGEGEFLADWLSMKDVYDSVVRQKHRELEIVPQHQLEPGRRFKPSRISEPTYRDWLERRVAMKLSPGGSPGTYGDDLAHIQRYLSEGNIPEARRYIFNVLPAPEIERLFTEMGTDPRTVAEMMRNMQQADPDWAHNMAEELLARRPFPPVPVEKVEYNIAPEIHRLLAGTQLTNVNYNIEPVIDEIKRAVTLGVTKQDRPLNAYDIWINARLPNKLDANVFKAIKKSLRNQNLFLLSHEMPIEQHVKLIGTVANQLQQAGILDIDGNVNPTWLAGVRKEVPTVEAALQQEYEMGSRPALTSFEDAVQHIVTNMPEGQSFDLKNIARNFKPFVDRYAKDIKAFVKQYAPGGDLKQAYENSFRKLSPTPTNMKLRYTIKENEKQYESYNVIPPTKGNVIPVDADQFVSGNNYLLIHIDPKEIFKLKEAGVDPEALTHYQGATRPFPQAMRQHPPMVHKQFPTVGWLKYQLVGREDMFSDEIQTDMLPALQWRLDHPRGTEDTGNLEPLTPEATKAIQDLVTKYEDWAEDGLATLLKVARDKGIKRLHIVESRTIQEKWPALSPSKIEQYYVKLPRKFGFNITQYDRIKHDLGANERSFIDYLSTVDSEKAFRVGVPLDEQMANYTRISDEIVDKFLALTKEEQRKVVEVIIPLEQASRRSSLLDSIRRYHQYEEGTIRGNLSRRDYRQTIKSGLMTDLDDTIKFIKSPEFLTTTLVREGTGGKLKGAKTSWRKPAIALTTGAAAAAEEWRRRQEEGVK